MADAVRMISENTAKVTNGVYLPKRFYDVLNPPAEDTRDVEEIVLDTITRAGLVVI